MTRTLLLILVFLPLTVASQDNVALLEQYKAEIAKQADSYPVKINERNILRNGYIEGNTHILEIQVIDRSKDNINEEEKSKIEKQLRSTIGALYCQDGTNESISRTLGLNIEYQYLDKDLDSFHSILFSQENCDKVTASASSKRTEKEVRTEMQIRELNLAGIGRVSVCKLSHYNGTVAIDYNNEIRKRAVIVAYDEYVVNSVIINLDKSGIAKFSQQILDAELRAQKHPNLDNLNLGEYRSDFGSIKLISQKGNMLGYFTKNVGVDRVLLSIDAKKISLCLAQIEPFL